MSVLPQKIEPSLSVQYIMVVFSNLFWFCSSCLLLLANDQ